ncbi:OB-fold protein [Intestinibacter sp.]|uniref:OB-fold protein n=1 Tax=Intestinibacter sp. TaxID=1965304 RepID=UPI002A7579AD|nr:hypothetical protein [Intestinibacter sp.]MDY2735729.1 hypothetical protein [Intestinibacter sp.]MDY4575928.1 hypothetical protein [Intestinibacter sp.]
MKKEKICRQCGEKIEGNTKKCLKCGADQGNFFSRHQGFTIIMVFFILICIAIGLIFNKLNHINNSDSAVYTQSEFESMWGNLFDGFGEDPCITAYELADEYENDQDDADETYIDTYIEVKGDIESIEKIDYRTVKVSLKTESDYKLDCYFDRDYNEKFEELENYSLGREITTVGALTRKNKQLKLEDCILGDWEVYYSFDNTFNIDIDLGDLLEDIKDKDKSIELKEDNIMSFDSDILEYGYTYEDIVSNMNDISDGEVDISYIGESNKLTEKVVQLEINSQEVNVKLSKDTSMFDENLVYLINKELEKSNSNKMFYYSYMDYDVDFGIANIAYSTEDDINKINEVLNDSDLEMDPFEKEVTTKSL